jgi:hypothetical protein
MIDDASIDIPGVTLFGIFFGGCCSGVYFRELGKL